MFVKEQVILFHEILKIRFMKFLKYFLYKNQVSLAFELGAFFSFDLEHYI